MSAPFVTQLRANRSLEVAKPGAGSLTLRVEIAELWDTVRVVARAETSIAEVKQRVIAEFFPDQQYADDFVLKLRGWEVLDERATVGEAGMVDGSILLLAFRRRRPVR